MSLDIHLVQKVTGIIICLLPKAGIYLFGSRARGDHHKWSDIDIALDTGGKIDHVAIMEVKDVLNALVTPYTFDIVDFQSVSSDMQEYIMKDKITWK